MKAYLIDPFAKTFEIVEYSGNYRQIYEYIKAGSFDVAAMENGDGIFVDDEGLLKPLDEQEYFVVRTREGQTHFLAGRALILGCDDNGDSIAPVGAFEEYAQLLFWVAEKEFAAKMVEQLLDMSGQVISIQ